MSRTSLYLLHVLAAFVVLVGVVCGVSGLVSVAFAEDGGAKPGEKLDPEHIRPAGPLPYPNLSTCKALKDESLYRGEDRVMKFVHVGTAGWLYRSFDFRTDFKMPEKTMTFMRRVNEALKAKGVDLYVVLQPSRAMVVPQHIDPKDAPEGYDPAVAKANYQALIAELQKNGIQTTDLSNPPSDFEYFFRGDPHWRREGAMWTAQEMSKLIKKNPLFKDRAPEAFSNEITWWLESEKGEFDEFVDKFCGVDIPPERRPMWATTAVAGEASADALFGDVTYPDIAIVGTSNTAHEEDFNFVGSLKQELGADIRNKAVAAGAFSGSSIFFYSSDEFHQHTPKIVIWEFLSHHIFDDYDGFRQMVPAIYGPCDEKDALAVAEGALKSPPGYVDPDTVVGPKLPAQAEALTAADYGPQLPNAKKRRQKAQLHELVFLNGLEKKNITPKNSYLYLEVKSPENRLLKIGALYANGDAEEIDVSRSRRAENNGKYYLEFNRDIDAPLMLLQIATDKPVGTVKARVCQYKNNAKQ